MATWKLLLEYDGRRLDRPDDLVAAVANCDHRTSLTLLRQGATVAIEVPPGSLEIALEPQ